MRCLYAASEVVPYSKTGGLADVAGALPRALGALGHEVVVVSPLHREVRSSGRPLAPLEKSVEIEIDGDLVRGDLHEDTAAEGARFVFVECDDYFDRDGIYGTPEGDHEDNAARFAFFSQAVLGTARTLGFYPDVVHVNDWQTALVPVYLKTTWSRKYGARRMRTLLTIHNLGYQGLFPPTAMETTGLPARLLNWEELEFHGRLNVLKGGLVFADHLSTVSETYAEEIRTEAFGCGLEGLLRDRKDDLTGIVNGIDYDAWNPATDRYLAASYDAEDLSGKDACKRALQEENGLEIDPDRPLVGMITRLAEQKGVDLVADALDEILDLGFQFVLLGTGDEVYEERFAALAKRHAGRAGIHLEFSNPMAHRIEAGADLFLMPSRYEPCGLNQLYSLRFATVPVVRPVGGLADTIVDATPAALERGEATGFAIPESTSKSLVATLASALPLYRDRSAWERIRRAGMAQDWSWDRSAREYESLYERLLDRE